MEAQDCFRANNESAANQTYWNDSLATDQTNMAFAITNSESKPQQAFPFMKLPPEIRLMIYEFAIRERIEAIERIEHVRTPNVRGMSVTAWLYAKLNLALKIEGECAKARAPYIGALALLQTSRLVFRESYWALKKVVYCHLENMYLRSKRLEGEIQSLNTNKFLADCKYSLLLENQTCAHVIKTIASSGHKSTTRLIKMDRGDRWARIVVNVEHNFTGICAGVQGRLQRGAGVRTSFRFAVKSHTGVRMTNIDVKKIIKHIASVFAPLKTPRGGKGGNRHNNGKVVKQVTDSKSESKEWKQVAIGKQPIGTSWLGEEMDTGP